MTAPTLLTQPEHHGLVDGMPLEEYLAVEALSAGSARKLLPPSCPALYRQDQLTPYRSDSMDIGHVAHSLVLEGLDLEDVAVEVPGNWSTKEPKAAKAAAEAAGRIPLHSKDAAAIRGMVAAMRSHPVAAALFDPSSGRPEVSLFWTEPKSGAPRKGRLDFLSDRRRSGRLILADYKSTSGSADPSEFGRTVLNFGYAHQLAGYEEGLRVLGIDDDPQLLLIVQETRPPYLIKPLEIPDEAMRIAREHVRQACLTYARCVETGDWPGYGPEVEQVEIPQWWLNRWSELAK